jgi:hypothetical protein
MTKLAGNAQPLLVAVEAGKNARLAFDVGARHAIGRLGIAPRCRVQGRIEGVVAIGDDEEFARQANLPRERRSAQRAGF